ncbi:uncharacterized protein BDZ99DRAFT_525502 [Mytilinidion resinicola]|uniref:Uncharacterized protein n=1 Tax=Mytilinidion resinicola TaxID=574789 RepID=A0A6A6Y778_9PEZI|nr:uncharacterized protein BDZ99DRAFT_525502 [Mytilinidion resinicola]KAF2804672.1 hypothetical protein BDZ99DRAFT_525502 [Mytilinidion resinicola]
MSCLFSSCFTGRNNAVSSRNGGSHIDNEDVRPRRVLVRQSAEKQGLFAQRGSFGRSSVSLVDEKMGLKEEMGQPETATLLHEDDEVVSDTYMSEKHIESGILDESLQSVPPVEVEVETEEESMVRRRHFHRRGILFRKPKTTTRKGGPVPMLKPHNTGDELQRRLDFERQTKKMDQVAAEKAWAIERQRRQQWDHEYKSNKSTR